MTDWDNLKILADKASLARYAAERIVRIANATLELNDTFSIALSGGSTPRPVYETLATAFASAIDWSRVHLWWGDERAVSPDDEQSNYRMVKEVLLDNIDIPEKNVHRIHGEDEPEQAAKHYENELRNFFKDDAVLFDLNLLGMGEDGHTASLFPHTSAIHEQEKWVLAHHVEAKGNLWRITLTPPAILKSANIMFLVSGSGKADVLKTVLEGDYQPDSYPSQLIVNSGHETVIWLIDEAAASKLK
jgi:6-phosphogluconolactonase